MLGRPSAPPLCSKSLNPKLRGILESLFPRRQCSYFAIWSYQHYLQNRSQIQVCLRNSAPLISSISLRLSHQPCICTLIFTLTTQQSTLQSAATSIWNKCRHGTLPVQTTPGLSHYILNKPQGLSMAYKPPPCASPSYNFKITSYPSPSN